MSKEFQQRWPSAPIRVWSWICLLSSGVGCTVPLNLLGKPLLEGEWRTWATRDVQQNAGSKVLEEKLVFVAHCCKSKSSLPPLLPCVYPAVGLCAGINMRWSYACKWSAGRVWGLKILLKVAAMESFASKGNLWHWAECYQGSEVKGAACDWGENAEFSKRGGASCSEVPSWVTQWFFWVHHLFLHVSCQQDAGWKRGGAVFVGSKLGTRGHAGLEAWHVKAFSGLQLFRMFFFSGWNIQQSKWNIGAHEG